MIGKLLGIAKRETKRGPIESIDSAEITIDAGVEGIYSEKPEKRRVTVLSRESWEATCKDLDLDIPWTTRRANLLIEDIDLKDIVGATLSIGGEVILEVTGETTPCGLMDKLQQGLLNALQSDWRGGILCKVISPGHVQVGDAVSLKNKSYG